MIRTICATLLWCVMSFVVNLSNATSATVDWSWEYTNSFSDWGVEIFIGPSESFDVEVDITNAATSDTTIYLAPYIVPQGYYYEGFYEFQSNLDNIVGTAIQPGETVTLNLGTWVPVGDGLPPYAHIQAQPKYLDVWYSDDGTLVLSGNESTDRLSFYVFQAISYEPYDDNNLGQGFLMTCYETNVEYFIVTLPELNATLPELSVPLPSSMLLLGFGLISIVNARRRSRF